MKQSEFNNVLLHLLIDIQSSVQANRDLLADVLTRIPESQPSSEWSDRMRRSLDGWFQNQEEYKNALLASLRNQFDPNLGSVDDLLKGIDPED